MALQILGTFFLGHPVHISSSVLTSRVKTTNAPEKCHKADNKENETDDSDPIYSKLIYFSISDLP